MDSNPNEKDSIGDLGQAIGMRVRPVSDDETGVANRGTSKALVPVPGQEDSVVSASHRDL